MVNLRSSVRSWAGAVNICKSQNSTATLFRDNYAVGQNSILTQIENHIKQTETELQQLKETLSREKDSAQAEAMRKKLKDTEERLWNMKMKISKNTKQWVGREESPC